MDVRFSAQQPNSSVFHCEHKQCGMTITSTLSMLSIRALSCKNSWILFSRFNSWFAASSLAIHGIRLFSSAILANSNRRSFSAFLASNSYNKKCIV
jgi:hypothetical protein